MSNKHTILRLTLKVDMENSKEILFVRAMLRRLNVLFAKCKPRGGLAELLNGSQLSEAYDGERSKPVKEETKLPTVIHYHTYTPPPKLKIDVIVERSMQPPVIEAEIVGD